ncbi:MAG TPA: hypothetical protein VM580_34990 [Labilithrix sp.]|jgi:acyl carrier protein|nr:hypothetical protein [Labilithrix sp.]
MIDLDAMLAVAEVPPGAEDDPLDLKSLQVVVLVEELESAFGIRLTGLDVTRANFVSRRAIRALLASKGVAT